MIYRSITWMFFPFIIVRKYKYYSRIGPDMVKVRTLYVVLAALLALLLVAGGMLVWLYWDKLPEEKDTEPGPIEVPADVWPQYRLTVRHDGRAHPRATLGGDLTLIWTSCDLNEDYYSASKSSPVVDEELVYIGADTGKLHALWRKNGTEAWSFRTHERTRNGIHGTAAFDKDKVYVGAYDGYLYALWKSNGTLVWENKLGDYIGSSPCLYQGVAYTGVEMGEPAGYLVGCNMTTGEEVFRSRKFGSHPHSTPSVDPERGYVYIGSNDRKVYCYDIHTGKEVWNHTTGGDIKSTPCVAGDILYITSWDFKLHALDLSTGAEYFTFATGMRTMSSPSVDSAGQQVYFGSHDGNIYCVDARSGAEKWRFECNKKVYSSPTLVERDGSVVCGSSDGHVYIIDTASGKEKDKIDFGIGITSVPTVVLNQLYVFDDEGLLHRYDAL